MSSEARNFITSSKYQESFHLSDAVSAAARRAESSDLPCGQLLGASAGSRFHASNYGPPAARLEPRAQSIPSLPSIREAFKENQSQMTHSHKMEPLPSAFRGRTAVLPAMRDRQDSLALPKFSSLAAPLGEYLPRISENFEPDRSVSSGASFAFSSSTAGNPLLKPSKDYSGEHGLSAQKQAFVNSTQKFYANRSRSYVGIDDIRAADSNHSVYAARSQSYSNVNCDKFQAEDANPMAAAFRKKPSFSFDKNVEPPVNADFSALKSTASLDVSAKNNSAASAQQNLYANFNRKRSKSVAVSEAENSSSRRSAEDIKRNIIQHLLSLENIPNEQLKKTILSVNSKSVVENHKAKRKHHVSPVKYSKGSKCLPKEYRKSHGSYKKLAGTNSNDATVRSASSQKYSLRARKKMYNFTENESPEEETDASSASSSLSDDGATDDSNECNFRRFENAQRIKNAQQTLMMTTPLSDQECIFPMAAQYSAADSDCFDDGRRRQSYCGVIDGRNVLKSSPALSVGRKLFFLSLVAKKAKELYFEEC